MPTLLMLSASPINQDRLRLGAEFRDIRHALQRSRNREEWKIESNEAATVDDLRRALLDFRPTVVHFSGHGGGLSGLCFEDSDGNTNPTDAISLTRLFHHFKDDLKCVVLNACFSKIQGQEIQKEIDYVIGMNSTVDDNSASKFAVAFYDAIFAGTNFRTAFDLGCTTLDLNNLVDANVPIFMTGSHLTPSVLSYSEHIPEVERVLYAYFNTPYSDRWKFTTSGNPLIPEMEKYYNAKIHKNVKNLSVIGMKLIDGDNWCIELSKKIESNYIYMRFSERNYLIEWEATVGLWSMPPKTFLALGSEKPVTARVKAELDTYYNNDFRGLKNVVQSISLFSNCGELFYGYVDRRIEIYDEIMEILSDGNKHNITIEIINAGDKENMVLITKLLSSSWIYTPPIETLEEDVS